ncbi:DNA excision repair protein ERCC-6-like [Lachnellula suecica]|uniref:DNA excision repair protein ERCC-6-like n=1 Tax=Lachnellula suecica TaxID=602035 RepID=A0A8T9C1Y5_9HELO|nr:DNA excision repair protein ERCC-6-like [Lachnellula suecica]
MLKKGLNKIGIKTAAQRKQAEDEERARELNLFAHNVVNLEMSKMTIHVLVMRTAKNEALQTMKIALSRFLFPGREHLAGLTPSYSWELFAATLESSINEKDKEPFLEIQHGHLEYEDDNEMIQVKNQTEFEVALNHLFKVALESKSEKMNFQFRPEKLKDRKLRLPDEVLEDEPEEDEDEVSLKPTDTQDVSGDYPTPKGSPKKSAIQTTTDAVKKTIRKARGKESAAGRAERLKTYYEEAERVVYKKGGDDDAEDIANAEAAEKIDDDEGSLDDDDDTDEISQEDKCKMMELPELTQFQDPEHPEDDLYRWKECCRLFQIDPTATGIDERVFVAGLRTKIYQYQAFGIYWQMITSRKYGGGFVGDDMGLGKTLSFLAYMVLERQLSVLWGDVLSSRTKKDGLHLAKEGQDENSQCPSPSKGPGWIPCPCAQSSITSQFLPKLGLRMACVPTALVRSWHEQWKYHVDIEQAQLALTIIVDHKGAFDGNSSKEELLSRSDQSRVNTISAAIRAKKGSEEEDKPAARHDGILVLTTKENYPAWVKSKHSYDGKVRSRDGTWKAGKRVDLVFGIAMIDECHEEARKETGRAKTLVEIPRVNKPFIWGYSGTPVSLNPRGLEGVFWAIERHTTAYKETHSNYPTFSWNTLNKLCVDFNEQRTSAVKAENDDAIDAVLARFKPFLDTFVMRRDQTTRWFGHPLIKINPHVHTDVKLKHLYPVYTPQDITEFEDKFQHEKDALLAKLQANYDALPEGSRTAARPTKLAFNTLCREQWRLSLLATFPQLLKLGSANDETKMDLTEGEVLFMRGSANKEKENGYYKNLTDIVEESPKALWLNDFIDRLDGQRDVNGEEQKLVIVTQFPQVAFILKLFLSHYRKDKTDRIGLVTGRMTLKEKSETIEAFANKNRNKVTKRDYQILIGTTRLLGVGLQLTRACNIVVMEPDHHYVRELQSYARVHRIGQKNPMSYSYRLINEASEIEQRVLKRQADRKEVPGKRVGKDDAAKLLPEIKEEEPLAGPSKTV